MKNRLWLAPVLVLGLAGAPALASSVEAGSSVVAEARIPFVNHGGIRDWHAGDGDTIYVQDRARRWYRAELAYRAFGLPHAWAIGFETRGIDSFDRFSKVVIDGQRIPVRSLVRVDAPPARHDPAQRDEA